MRKFLSLLAVIILCGAFVYADGTDSYDNYLTGTGAGTGLSTVTYGRRGATNVFVGPYAGTSDTTGNGNVGIGYGALRRNTTGSGNVAIGYGAGGTATTGVGKLFIETYLYPATGIYGDFATGYFGINNTSPSVALDITGDAAISGAISLSAITSDDRIVTSDTLMVSVERTPAGADSSLYLTTASGNPFVGFRATDGDLTNITVNTADQLFFAGATGGYEFDDDVVSTTMLSVRSTPYSNATDSTATLTLPNGNPLFSLFATDGDTWTMGIDTDDKAVFAGASGGYTFDAVIDGSDIANTTIGAGGASTGAFTTITGDSIQVKSIATTSYAVVDGAALLKGGVTVTGDIIANGDILQGKSDKTSWRDFTAETGTITPYNISAYTSGIDPGDNFKAINVSVTDSSSAQSSGTWTGLKAGDFRTYKKAGVGAVDAGASQGSPSGEEVSGIRTLAAINGGTARNLFASTGVVQMDAGTTVMGHIQNPGVVTGGFFTSTLDIAATVDHAVVASLIGQVAGKASENGYPSDAGVLSMLVGAADDSTSSPVSGFRLADYSIADNFDYGLDLVSPDVGWANAGTTYQKFDVADIRLLNGETIDNTTDGVIAFSGILKMELQATLPDTTGFEGGEMFTFTGDSLYIYKADHSITSIP